MLRTLKKYPLIGIALVLLSCIRSEYNAQSWAMRVPGLVGAIVVLGIIAVVLLFRIFNALHDACVARGLIPRRLHFRYGVLIPVSIIAVMIQGYWQGGMVQAMGHEEKVPQWVFAWSDPYFAAPFVGAVVAVVLLHRVFVLVGAIANPPGSPG